MVRARELSAAEEQEVQTLIQRKLRGKRIILADKSENIQFEFRRRTAEPGLARELSRAQERKIAFIEAQRREVPEEREAVIERREEVLTDPFGIPLSPGAIFSERFQPVSTREGTQFEEVRTGRIVRLQARKAPETFRGDLPIDLEPDIPRKETITEEPPGISREAFGPEPSVVRGVEAPGLEFGASAFPPFFVKPKSLIERSRFELEKFGGGLETKRLRGEPAPFLLETGIGFGTSLLTTAEFTKEFATSPFVTTGRAVTGIGALFVTGAPFIATTIKERPFFATGFVAGEVFQFRAIPFVGRKAVTTTTDIFRTRGAKELSSTDIIAKEIAMGQTFPLIRRGETAGEFLKEFRPLLPGEIRPAGFTSAPRPFVGEAIGRGLSELPGLFQSPKVSPHFLRISAEEEKLFSFSLLGESLRPSVFRITPEEFKLVPGLKPGQTGIQAIGPVRKFFEEAPKGKSFVPFIKTEKEAIIPFGTQVTPRGLPRFFFKFEKRRIPIFEFETVPGVGKKTPSGLPTAGDISRSLSESRVGRRGKFSLIDVPSSRAFRVSRRDLVSSRVLSSLAPSIRKGPTFSAVSDTFRKPTRGRPSRGLASGRIGSGGISSAVSRPRPLKGFKPFPPFFPGRILEPTPKKKKGKPFFGDIDPGVKLSKQFRLKRKFQRTPSLGAVILQKELGFKQQKFSKELERTGLFARKFIRPQTLKPLGPIPIRKRKK